MSALRTKTRCRTLVAGFGRPGMRDLDFGRQLVRYLEGIGWPEGVVVEDLSYAALLVLHRLQELEPEKLVLVGAAARGLDPPGTLRRYQLDSAPPAPGDVQRCLEESVQGVVDLDHTLAVARHWGALPAETVVIEVEPAECFFGVGFSDELAAAFDAILAMVRDELGAPPAEVGPFDLDRAAASMSGIADTTPPVPGAVAPSPGLMELVRFAHEHEQVRLVQCHRGASLLDRSLGTQGLEVAGRSLPWGVSLDNGGDWFDVIPLEEGWVGVVIGDVTGRGVEGAGAMADLRAALRAYAVLDGTSPAGVVNHLDRLACATGIGKEATLVYVAVHASTGELRLSNAGHCPPLVVAGGDDSWFLRHALAEPLGATVESVRREETLRLDPGSTLLLFTDGLVQSRERPLADGLERLRRAAGDAACSVDDLCDHVLDVCTDGLRRDDDISLLALRLSAGGGWRSSTPGP